MPLSQRVRPFGPHLNLIWRFYADENHLWRWQRLASDGTVVEHSKSGYKLYESCQDNANEHDYLFLPSTTTKGTRKPLVVKRAYANPTTDTQAPSQEYPPEDLELKGDMLSADDLGGAMIRQAI